MKLTATAPAPSLEYAHARLCRKTVGHLRLSFLRMCVLKTTSASGLHPEKLILKSGQWDAPKTKLGNRR
jgi:hypothetical protein